MSTCIIYKKKKKKKKKKAKQDNIKSFQFIKYLDFFCVCDLNAPNIKKNWIDFNISCLSAFFFGCIFPFQAKKNIFSISYLKHGWSQNETGYSLT